MIKQYLYRIVYVYIIFCSLSLFAKQPDFLIHYHPHLNAEELVQSKEKSNLTYKQLMQEFGVSYSIIQEGIITQDKLAIELGLDAIQNHPSTKNNPWDIVKKKDKKAFQETLLYYDELLHKSIFNVKKSLKTDDWITINKNIFMLSNHCINCHIIWKDNLKLSVVD